MVARDLERPPVTAADSAGICSQAPGTAAIIASECSPPGSSADPGIHAGAQQVSHSLAVLPSLAAATWPRRRTRTIRVAGGTGRAASLPRRSKIRQAWVTVGDLRRHDYLYLFSCLFKDSGRSGPPAAADRSTSGSLPVSTTSTVPLAAAGCVTRTR